MPVTITYLQMTGPAALAPPSSPRPPLQLERVAEPDPELNRGLYAAVGGDWQWTDRLPWTPARWREWLARPGRETWLARVDGEIAGYAELAGEANRVAGAHETGGAHMTGEAGTAAVAAEGVDRAGAGTDVEIVYFGLLPHFTGRGLGGHVLADVLVRAWSLPSRWPALPPARRVWLHTCSLDSPRALANYRARGLEVYRTEHIEREAAAG